MQSIFITINLMGYRLVIADGDWLEMKHWRGMLCSGKQAFMYVVSFAAVFWAVTQRSPQSFPLLGERCVTAQKTAAKETSIYGEESNDFPKIDCLGC